TDDHSLLLSLASLTGLRLGLAVCIPGVRQTAVRLGSTKVFSFIPSRYGHVSALTCATDCVVAKRRAMVTDGDEAEVLVRYSKALRALQVALDDDERERCAPETLCATLLLGVFELLSLQEKPFSWLHHIEGATRLLQVRGAGSYESEFELALLTAHVGPAVTEAFLTNKPCFLAQEPWRQLLRVAVLGDESLAGHADIVLPLWEHLVGGPSHFKRTTDIICGEMSSCQDRIDNLVDCLVTSRDQLLGWLELAKEVIGLEDEDIGGPTWRDAAVFPLENGSSCQDDDDIGLALRGTYATCRLLKARLLVALAPARFYYLEEEAQELAARVMSLGEGCGGGSLVASLFMSQGSWIAKSILETKDAWAGVDCDNDGAIARCKFEAWCDAMGRRVVG
ncbi:hypothetical protein QBC34DRAFT_310890, partial [Podospora aff. communis PSN243]